MAGIEPHRVAAASGLSNFARITAGAFGTSIATTVWDDRATLHHAHLVERVGTPASGPFAEVWSQLTAAGLTPDQIAAQVNRLIDQQAFTRAADDVFYGSAFLFLLLVGMVWFSRPPKAGAAAADAGGAH
jgi:MFS transporter, DHA2 family, multidrug resistance protein